MWKLPKRRLIDIDCEPGELSCWRPSGIPDAWQGYASSNPPQAYLTFAGSIVEKVIEGEHHYKPVDGSLWLRRSDVEDLVKQMSELLASWPEKPPSQGQARKTIERTILRSKSTVASPD